MYFAIMTVLLHYLTISLSLMISLIKQLLAKEINQERALLTLVMTLTYSLCSEGKHPGDLEREKVNIEV